MIKTVTYKSIATSSKVIFIFLATLTILSCGGSNKLQDPEQYRDLKEMVLARNFDIEHNWAFPNSANNIDLIGNPNYINFEQDSVDIYLPYFGVRQFGGNYSESEVGIIYEGSLNNYELIENEKKGNIEIKFDASKNTEVMNFTITLYPNKKVRTRVVSNQRTPISYEGKYESKREN